MDFWVACSSFLTHDCHNLCLVLYLPLIPCPALVRRQIPVLLWPPEPEGTMTVMLPSQQCLLGLQV
jgi:hypothetical protein